MKNYFIKITLAVTTIGTLSCATSEKWLDDGDVVHTVETNTLSKTKNTTSTVENQVTLGTGETVTLIGGVYVKAKNPDSIVTWANESGYKAKKDKYIKGAVHIETTPEVSIYVANQVAKLDDVTTSAPKYRRTLITK
jgi:hypothetical protein